MKEFLEPRLEILQFYAEDILTVSGDIEGAGDGSDGDQTPVIPFN